MSLFSGEIWSTDLDVLVPHTDRITVLATLQPPVTTTTTSVPLMNPVVSAGALDHLAALALSTTSPTYALHSASLLRGSDKTSQNQKAQGSYSAMSVPSAHYLRDNDGRNRGSYQSKFPSIGKLPVGSTVPLAKLGVNIPSTRLNNVDGTVSSPNSIISSSQKAGSKVRPTFDDASLPSHHHKVIHDTQPLPLGRGLVWKPVSPEFLNFIMALFLYAIRLVICT